MKLFINTAKDATNAVVAALDNNTRKSVPSLFFGDTIPIELCFTDGNGGYADWSGETDLKLKIAVGDIDDATTYALTETFTYSAYTYSGTLVLQTTALANVLSGKESLPLALEVEVLRTNGEAITPLQASVNVRNTLINTATHDGSSTNEDLIWLHYPFNAEPIAGSVIDEAQDNDGSAHNTTLANGKFGNAFHFNGTTSHVNAGNIGNLGEAYTFSVWFKSDVANTTKTRTVLSLSNYNNNWHKPLTIWQESSTLKVRVQYNGGTDQYFEYSSPISNEWIHLSVIRNGKWARIYKDGIEVANKWHADWGNYHATRFEIGARHAQPTSEVLDYFEGSIDDVRVYEKALTESEIQTLADASNPNPNTNIDNLTPIVFNQYYDGQVLELTAHLTTPSYTIAGDTYFEWNTFIDPSSNSYILKILSDGTVEFVYEIFETSTYTYSIGTWDANGFNLDANWHIELRVDPDPQDGVNETGIKIGHGTLP
jgi:hypothetical protein